MATVIDNIAELSFKTCIRCGQSKPRTDFENNRARICNDCKIKEEEATYQKELKKAEHAEWIEQVYQVIRNALDYEKYMTVRHAFYLVESANLVTKDDGYKKVQPLILEWRRQGKIGWSEIIDTSRSRALITSFDGLADYQDTVLQAYKFDYWLHMPTYVEIHVEKAAIVGIVERIVREQQLMNIPLVALKGQASDTSLFDTAVILKERQEMGQKVKLIYLGDFDPSGINIPRTEMVKLTNQFGVRDIDFERICVNPEDVENLHLTTHDIKTTDKSAPGFIKEFGTNQGVELDTLSAPQIQERLAAAIKDCIDYDMWSACKEQEKQDKIKLQGWFKEVGN